MSKESIKELEKRRRETSVKSMYFNRYLLVRYITAGFFFTNLYWFCSLLMSNKVWAIVPSINLLFLIKSALEQGTMFSSPIDNAKETILAYKVILGVNLMLVVALFTPLFDELFPFLTDEVKSHNFILGIIFIGMIFCAIVLKRLQKIKNRTDRQFKYAKQFERVI